MKCDLCENEATIHITEIRRGLSYDRHLCERCAGMFLPLEESDYADYLEILPPRYSTHIADESAPTEQELEMTGIRQQVVVVDLRTGEARHVGPESGDCFSPVWSPDSRRLGLCHSIETLQSLVLLEAEGPWSRRFLHTTFAEPASWSPDGTMITFSHPEDGPRIVLAAEITKGGLHRLSTVPYLDEFMPVWSPVDERIAFVSQALEGTEEEKRRSRVLVARPGADERRRIVTLDEALVACLDWSDDARFLAALAATPGREDTVEVFAWPEGRLHVMPSTLEDASDTELPGSFASFAWVSRAAGREGPALLAAALSEDQQTSTVLLVDPGTHETRTVAEGVLLPANEVHAEHLSPDGKTLIALEGADHDRIARIDLEKGTRKVVALRAEVAWLGWHPQGKEIAALIRIASGVRMEMISPTLRRREIATFRREDFFDVPRMVLSPDGTLAAVELHAPRTE